MCFNKFDAFEHQFRFYWLKWISGRENSPFHIGHPKDISKNMKKWSVIKNTKDKENLEHSKDDRMSNNDKITEACLYKNKVHKLKVSVTK